MSHIGERVATRRRELGMTQQELADRLGYKSKTTINKIELGINDLRQRKIMEFAHVLKCSPAYLMGWTDDPIPQNIVESVEPEDIAPDDVIYYKGKKLDLSSLSEQDKDNIAKYIEFIINSKNGG